jgi:hypothetical protein
MHVRLRERQLHVTNVTTAGGDSRALLPGCVAGPSPAVVWQHGLQKHHRCYGQIPADPHSNAKQLNNKPNTPTSPTPPHKEPHQTLAETAQ